MERHQVQKGSLDTALRVTAIATMIILTLCVASFGLSKLRLPAQSLAQATANPREASELPVGGDSVAPGVSPGRPVGPDPLAEHLERLGDRLEELASTVSQERATQSEIARLADSMQAARQQADLSNTKIQHELGNLRVTSEVELRDLNRQIDTVAEKSHRLSGKLSNSEPEFCQLLRTSEAQSPRRSHVLKAVWTMSTLSFLNCVLNRKPRWLSLKAPNCNLPVQ